MPSLKRLGSKRFGSSSRRSSFSAPPAPASSSSKSKKTGGRQSWAAANTPASGPNRTVKKSASITVCEPSDIYEPEFKVWEEGKKYEKEAKSHLERMRKETKFFDPDREDALPRFDHREVTRGKLLGRGGFSAVHEVKELKLLPGLEADCDEPRSAEDADARKLMSKMCIRNGDARYAVKKILVDGKREPERYMKGLLDLAIESKFLAVMEHPHLIKIRAVSNKDPCTNDFFIILDRLYDTLGQRLVVWKKESWKSLSFRKKLLGGVKLSDPLTATRLVAALDIGAAILHMHSNYLIYRDLKPENVGFDVRDDVKVFDLGLAKEVHPNEALKDGTFRLTGMTGSLRYMAPEVATKKPYNFAADVYSFGILLWQILAMDVPFKGLNVQMHHEYVIGRGTRPDIPPKWPQAWKVLVRKCWASRFEDRPPMERVLDDLRTSLSTLHGSEEDYGLDVSGRTNKSIEQLMMSSRTDKSIEHAPTGGLSAFLARETSINAVGLQH